MVANTGYSNPGQDPYDTSPDYNGSYEQWKADAVRMLAERYAAGDQSLLDNLTGATAPVGQPYGGDFGKHTISAQTIGFWEKYLDAYGAKDFGAMGLAPPPTRHATHVPSPSSPGETNAATNAAAAARQAAADAAEAARQKAQQDADYRRSQMEDAGATGRVQIQVGSNEKIATMQDATARYKAEGDWGTQKYVAELGEKGAMDRLMQQLGFDREKLYSDAKIERDKLDFQYKGLALDIAKYDSELAAQPANIWKYAAWLQNRGQVVNGLNIAMASSIVAPEQISAAEVGMSGAPAGVSMQAIGPSDFQGDSSKVATGAFRDNAQTSQGMAPIPGGSSAPPADGVSSNGGRMVNSMPGMQTPPTAPQLQGGTDYAALTNQLLGMNPMGGDAPSLGQMQGITDSRTQQLAGKGGGVGGFSAWQGPTTNALGVNVGDPSGQKVDYRQFADAPWAQQQMKLADAQSVGLYGNDFLGQLQRARPKGSAVGAAAWG